ncbi:MAG: CO dehydrogenase/acetyl-CoA synthase subunit delta [Candidatus Helarchaeota archaeon]
MSEEIKKIIDGISKDAEEIVLKNVAIVADQLGFELQGGGGADPRVPYMQAGIMQAMQILQGAVGGQVMMPSGAGLAPGIAAVLKWKAQTFNSPVETYPGEIVVVEFCRSGKGGEVVKAGGQKAMNFYNFDSLMPHTPIVTGDVFDIPIHKKGRESFLRLSKPVKDHFLNGPIGDVSTDVGEWAKANVKYGAQMVTMHNIGTDPTIPKKLGGQKSPREAAKNLEEVLQAVKCPVVIGGSGNPTEDIKVFEACAAVSESERLLISSTNLDDYTKIVPIAKKYDHNILGFTQLDLNNAKKLNAEMLKLGMPKDHIVMDPTCAPLGYGIQYSFSIYQRIRLAALKGETDIQCPMSGGTTNAWGAREAFLANKVKPEWGERNYRGPLWEILTAFMLSIAGLDIAMMLHPLAIQSFRQIVTELTAREKAAKINHLDWLTMEV